MTDMNLKTNTLSVVLALAALTGSSLNAQVRSNRNPPDRDQHLYLRGQDLRELGITNEGDTNLHGREEGDNGFRDRTPALDRSDRKTKRVDQDKLYAQRLALYENPGALPAGIAPVTNPKAAAKQQALSATHEKSEEGSSTTTIIFALLLVLCAGLGYKTLRKN